MYKLISSVTSASQDTSHDKISADNNAELESEVEQPNISLGQQHWHNNVKYDSNCEGVKYLSHEQLLARQLQLQVNISHQDTSSDPEAEEITLSLNDETDCDDEDCERVEEESPLGNNENKSASVVDSCDSGDCELRPEDLQIYAPLKNESISQCVQYDEESRPDDNDALFRGDRLDDSQDSNGSCPPRWLNQSTTASQVPSPGTDMATLAMKPTIEPNPPPEPPSIDSTSYTTPVAAAGSPGVPIDTEQILFEDISDTKFFLAQFGNEENDCPLMLEKLVEIIENDLCVYLKPASYQIGLPHNQSGRVPLYYVFPPPVKYPEKYMKELLKT